VPGLETTTGRRRSLPALVALGGLLGASTCIGALALAVALQLVRHGPISAEHGHVLLTVAMAMIGAAAAILGTVAGPLAGNRRLSWLAAAVAAYCLFVLPVTILRPGPVPVDAPPQATWLAGQVFVVGLLAVTLRPPARLGDWATWVAVALGAVAAQVTGEVVVALTAGRPGVLGPAVLTAAVLAGWVTVGLGLLLAGYRDRDVALAGVAVGLTLLACVHLYATTAGPAARGIDLLRDQLRLGGLIIVFGGMLGLARRALTQVHAERLAHDEEIRLAAVHLQRTADRAVERDHELRNGLAGLSGITTRLAASTTSVERAELNSAMLTELARLTAVIDGTGPGDGRAGYDVTVELDRLVRAGRATGMQIELTRPDAGLRAAGTPAVLGQVMANLLANCGRHAPGSAVWVRAEQRGRRILIDVRDRGPGIPAGRELAVLDRGVRDPSTGGDGLGLYLSRRLLAAEGADLHIRPAEPDSPGCTVVVELPTTTDAADVPRGRQDRARCPGERLSR
jgi:two-component system OmpR family sensor kinase